MNSRKTEYARQQVSKKTPEAVIELIATQMSRLDEAKRRIDEEGLVVRDMKGSVIAHPAIKIEIEAGKLMVDLISKNSSKY